MIDAPETLSSATSPANRQSHPAPRADEPTARTTASGMFRAKMAPLLSEAGRSYRRPDLIAQLPKALSFLAWGAAAMALMYYDNARPRRYGLDRFFNAHREVVRDAGEQAASYLLLLSLSLALLGLAFNAQRMRRKDDRYSRSLVVLVMLSLVALIDLILI